MSRIVRDVVLRIQIQPPNIAGAVGGGGGRFIAGGGARATTGAAAVFGAQGGGSQNRRLAQGLRDVDNAARRATRSMSSYANSVGLASLEMARLFTWSRLVTRLTFGVQELGASRIPGLVGAVGAGGALAAGAGAISVGAQFATGQLGIGLPQTLGGRGFIQGAEGITGRVGRAAFGASIGRALSAIAFTARNPFAETTRRRVVQQGFPLFGASAIVAASLQPLGIGPRGIVFRGPGGDISRFDPTQSELDEIAAGNVTARQTIAGFRNRRQRLIALGGQTAQEQIARQLGPFNVQRQQGLLGGVPGAVDLANRQSLTVLGGLANRFGQQRELGGGVFSLGQQLAVQQQITATIGRQARDLLQTSREQTQELQRELSVRRQIQQTIEQQVATLQGRRRGALRFAAGAAPGELRGATRAIQILQEGGPLTPFVRQRLLGLDLPEGLRAEFQRRLEEVPRFGEFAELFAPQEGILAGRRRQQQVGQAQADTRSALDRIIDSVRSGLIDLLREGGESAARERALEAEGADLARERQLIGIQEQGGQ